MTLRVDIKPQLLNWACERSGLPRKSLTKRFPKFEQWVSGEMKPTLKQAEAFASVTHTPVGYLFLLEPPVEQLPIPDFRTIGNSHIDRPSPDLLDTVHICQQRQEWFQEFARMTGAEPLPFVGTATTKDNVVETAARMRATLDFDLEERRKVSTWGDALRKFIETADDAGLLVMINGVVGSNTHRKLDPDEFRGFALADDVAPLVFINGADSKAAQMFTLAHELAHIFLGKSALSDVGPSSAPSQRVEQWCNKVAAEFLVPLKTLKQDYDSEESLDALLRRLSRLYKVSSLVVLRRLLDARKLSTEQFWRAYKAELAKFEKMKPKGSGGNFYALQSIRTGKRFARAMILSTLEGQTLYRDAFQLLGFSKHSTFQELGAQLGVA